MLSPTCACYVHDQYHGLANYTVMDPHPDRCANAGSCTLGQNGDSIWGRLKHLPVLNLVSDTC